MLRDHLDLALINPGGVLVQLRTARPACGGNHFRSLAECRFDDAADAVGFLQGGAWRKCRIDIQCTFVKGRQEFAPHERNNRQGRHQHDHRRCDDLVRPPLSPTQKSGIVLLQPHHESRFRVVLEKLSCSKQVVAESGRDGECNDQRRRNRDDIGKGQRRKHAAFESAEAEQRKECKHDDQRCKNDGIANLTGSPINDGFRR